MNEDIRMKLANEIDRVNADYNKETSTKNRKYLLEQSRALLTALMTLNDIQDRIINDV